MKSAVLLIVILIGAVGLEPIATVVADRLDSYNETDEGNGLIKGFPFFILPMIAGILFISTLSAILIGQKQRKNTY
jgi:hypothetical protein